MAIAVCGCRSGSRRNSELLEARIRNQEESIAALRRSATTLEAERDTARREVEAVRASLEKPGQPVIRAEHAETQLRVSNISISRLLSGGLDRDAEFGDELLTVVVVPVDESGETLRASGTLEIDAVDFGAPAGQQQIGRWQFDREQTQSLWHAGIIGRGIQVTVPWQLPPRSESVTVHARLTLPDGRQFDTTEALRVSPPSAVDGVPTSSEAVGQQPSGRASVNLQPQLLPNGSEQSRPARTN